MFSGEEINNLCCILQEDSDAFVVDSVARDPLALFPHIARTEELCEVCVEGTLVAACGDISEAVVLVWAMTVFHQKHSKAMKKMSVFLERYVLGVYRPVQVPLVVSTSYDKLSRPHN